MDKEFYAVAAQVIPTLFVALALEVGLRGVTAVGRLLIAAAGLMGFIGEFVSMRVLMDWRPTESWETVVQYGLFGLLGFVVAIFLVNGIKKTV